MKKKEEEININLGFADLFKGIGNIVELIQKMGEEGKCEISRTGEITGLDKTKGLRGVYGFTIKMGNEGLSKINSFGNIGKDKNGFIVEEVIEPIVDVFDEGDTILVIAELPGAGENDLNLELKDDIIVISAAGNDRKYYKEVLLPVAVNQDMVKPVLKNGILEIRLVKTKLT